MPTLSPSDAAITAARNAWPGIQIDDSVFLAYVNDRSPDLAYTSDLYLACACAGRDPAAIRAFEESFLSEIPTFLSRLQQPSEFHDEVKQRVRERLFVSQPGQPPKIAEYAGRGALGGWLRLVAVRTALMMLRGTRADPLHSAGDQEELPALGTDPELDLLRSRHRDDFRAAFESALAQLPVSERNLLRMHHVDNLTIDELAVLYKRHRSTVARQIAGVREQILQSVRDHLIPKLGLRQGEVDSLIAALRSHLDVSVLRFLKKTDDLSEP
jgi:RNA polymerase sigma-70 factor (ECF subfamily)